MRTQVDRNTRSQQKADTTRARLAKILTLFIDENCSAFEWAPRFRDLIRSRSWGLLYKQAEALSTAVFQGAHEHLCANQLSALILKAPLSYKEFGFEMDPESKALEKFHASERRCHVSNRRLSNSRLHKSRFGDAVTWMGRWIERQIGEFPDLESIYDKCGFSSGAALGVHGNATHIGKKLYANVWTVSPSAVPYVKAAMWKNFHMVEFLLSQGDGPFCIDRSNFDREIDRRLEYRASNHLSFVPKTAKTHRGIAVEPLLNTFIQKGIDAELRVHLKRAGYDLSNQERNQHLARIGSYNGTFATIDLSSASDSISISLVKALLPSSWFSLMDCTRSPAYETSDGEFRYQKFVSMGNGFCFPLETLLFAAACRYVLRNESVRTHAVYGDDIIVPSTVAPELLELLKFMGFTPNPDKTFLEGPFRESCGSDWYRGLDVRPVYLDFPLNKTESLMGFHNATLRSTSVAELFVSIRAWLREVCPVKERLVRPPFGHRTCDSFDPLDLRNVNGAFTVPLDIFMCSGRAKWLRSQQRWSWSEFCYTPISDPHQDAYPKGRYLAFLLGSQGGQLNLRRQTKRIVIRR